MKEEILEDEDGFMEVVSMYGTGPDIWYYGKVGGHQIRDGDKVEIKLPDGIICNGTATLTQVPHSTGRYHDTGQDQFEIESNFQIYPSKGKGSSIGSWEWENQSHDVITITSLSRTKLSFSTLIHGIHCLVDGYTKGLRIKMQDDFLQERIRELEERAETLYQRAETIKAEVIRLRRFGKA
jgi:hypothetical protein